MALPFVLCWKICSRFCRPHEKLCVVDVLVNELVNAFDHVSKKALRRIDLLVSSANQRSMRLNLNELRIIRNFASLHSMRLQSMRIPNLLNRRCSHAMLRQFQCVAPFGFRCNVSWAIVPAVSSITENGAELPESSGNSDPCQG